MDFFRSLVFKSDDCAGHVGLVTLFKAKTAERLEVRTVALS